ncbi:aminotransferase [Thalassolituus marinus]|uniref:Aminotransferase class III-fold pyridoxal phosphate-dependent enzyme n=1 Tax=Thalassolituus marinus TaxID=671053 RepID=A0ABS7ZP78_9GAMM|nr:aminotransferase [Thalassolituus marinus]MCA6063521.1 aminotransferase class III-fold pyridoxal phosphate-dependent enzyme [Thalassolituus marinus]
MSTIIYPTSNLKTGETLSIARGEGVYVYDDQGNKYLEGMAGLWCTSLGYNHPELIEAATQQLHNLSYSHMFGGKTHQVGKDLAEKIRSMVPVDDAHIFFGNSGSDANDTQIKLLRYYFNAIGKPEKRKIIARKRSYHGITVASACLTGLEVNHTNFDLPVEALGIIRTDAPYYLREKLAGESEAQFVDRIVGNLEKQIIAEGPETIAAFIAEPITGASGVIIPPAGYYEKVQALLTKYDIFFWADEVITGFGRTGNDFGCTTMGIKPDMMSLAKQLSSAYLPISAAVVKGGIYQAMIEPSNQLGVFGHGYTYSGHPVACAVSLKTLEIYQRDEIFARAASNGEYLQAGLQQFADHPLVGEVRGRGLIAAVDLHNRASDEAFPATVPYRLQQACQDHGLILRAVGGTAIAFCPPLIISREQIDELLGKFARALDDTLQWATQQGLI